MKWDYKIRVMFYCLWPSAKNKIYNLYKMSSASRDAIAGLPGFDGMGRTLHKFLEMSNVSVVNETSLP